MKRLSLIGSWPITARTRSAKRSKPQRMSVTSTASQIRGPCVRSSARKLGRPIMLPLPIPKAMRADDAHRIRALPPGFGLRGSRTSIALPATAGASFRDSGNFHRLRTSPLPLREHSSSSRKTANHEDPAHDRTPQQSGRSRSVRKPTFATSPTLPFARASSLYTAIRRGDLQDGVYIALTSFTEEGSHPCSSRGRLVRCSEQILDAL